MKKNTLAPLCVFILSLLLALLYDTITFTGAKKLQTIAMDRDISGQEAVLSLNLNKESHLLKIKHLYMPGKGDKSVELNGFSVYPEKIKIKKKTHASIYYISKDLLKEGGDELTIRFLDIPPPGIEVKLFNFRSSIKDDIIIVFKDSFRKRFTPFYFITKFLVAVFFVSLYPLLLKSLFRIGPRSAIWNMFNLLTLSFVIGIFFYNRLGLRYCVLMSEKYFPVLFFTFFVVSLLLDAAFLWGSGLFGKAGVRFSDKCFALFVFFLLVANLLQLNHSPNGSEVSAFVAYIFLSVKVLKIFNEAREGLRHE